MRVPKFVIAAFAALALALIGLNVALVNQNRTLARLNRTYEANLHLSVGQKITPLLGTDLAGTPVTVSCKAGGPKALLLIFARDLQLGEGKTAKGI